MTEHERLLKDVLKGEWGFDGVVTSDWHAARSTTATALATLDLSMPGPEGPWGERLASAVAEGLVTEEVLDDKLIRLLNLAREVGALGGSAVSAGPVRFVDPQLLRRATAASFVLLSNTGPVLPLDAGRLRELRRPRAARPIWPGGL